MGRIGGNDRIRFFLESRKKQRTCVVVVKATGFKLEGGTAAPVAGKNLNRSVWSKLRPGDSSFFPFGRASHALR